MNKWLRANKGFLMFLMLFGIFRTAVADWNPIPSASMRPNPVSYTHLTLPTICSV